MEAQRILKTREQQNRFSKYANDPVGFATEILGNHFTEDTLRVIESVRDNPVTIAKSGNATGKTFTAARIAVWFFMTFPESQVYLVAAPPLDNLKRILWGELSSIIVKHPQLFEGYRSRSLAIIRTGDVKDPKASLIAGLTIPTSGSEKEREAKFCADADDLFEMNDGSIVKYGELIGRNNVPVVSVNERMERRWEFAEFFNNGTKLMYEIELDDGEIIRRTGNHPLYAGWDIRQDFRVHDGRHVKGRIQPHQEGWREIVNLREGDAILGPMQTDFSLGTDEIDESRLKFLAYMIGDGYFGNSNKRKTDTRLQFTQDRNVQLSEFITLLDEMNATYTTSDIDTHNWVEVNIKDDNLKNFVEEIGLANQNSEHKFIPEFVFRLNREQISLFLNRLFSTDGWASLGNKAEIGYASKSRRLIFDIQRLLRRFGIFARISSKIVRWKYNDEERSGLYWSLSINHSFDVVRFAENIGIYGKEISVDACYEYAQNRVWDYAGWRFVDNQYRWRKIKSIRVIGERSTVGVYVPDNHTYLTSLVEHNSGKHPPHLLFIVDEGDAVPEEVYAGIETCMSGGHSRMLVMFNPRSATGPVYMKELNHQAHVVHLSALNHPNVLTGKDVIPGAVTREVTLRRINEWTRPLVKEEKPDAECFNVPDFLVGQTTVSSSGIPYEPLPEGYRKIVEPSFSYVVLGEYPAQAVTQLINLAWINLARTRYDNYVKLHGDMPPASILPIMGVDVAEYGADWNCAFFRWGGYVAKPILWQGLDTTQTAAHALNLYRNHNANIVMVDGTGVGSGVAPAIARSGRTENVRAISVKAANSPSPLVKSDLGEFKSIRDQMWWALREWLRADPDAMLPPDLALMEELKTPTYEIKNGKIIIMDKEKMRQMLHRSPDRADALCLTFAPYNRATVTRLVTKEEMTPAYLSH